MSAPAKFWLKSRTILVAIAAAVANVANEIVLPALADLQAVIGHDNWTEQARVGITVGVIVAMVVLRFDTVGPVTSRRETGA